MKSLIAIVICAAAFGVSAEATNPPVPKRSATLVETQIFRHLQKTIIDMEKRCFKGAALMFSEKAACQQDAHHVKSLLALFSRVEYSGGNNGLLALMKSWENVTGPRLIKQGIIDEASLR